MVLRQYAKQKKTLRGIRHDLFHIKSDKSQLKAL